MLVTLFDANFFHGKSIIYHYYPELEDVEQKDASILVLAGSVLYAGTVYDYDGDPQVFCNMLDLLNDQNVISLAQPAHNSLDSWYKYQFLKDFSFEYVIWYHNINDNRANNCIDGMFDIDYRHVEFYDELYIYHRHKELNITVLPYVIDILILRLKNEFVFQKYIPKEFFYENRNEFISQLLDGGATIKSSESIKRNLESVLKLSASKNEQVIIPAYAWYIPDNYSRKLFDQKALDYDAQIFPVELYGRAPNIKKGLKIHEKVIKEIVTSFDHAIYIDFNDQLPKSAQNFDDVCHLSESGCEALAAAIRSAISP